MPHEGSELPRPAPSAPPRDSEAPPIPPTPPTSPVPYARPACWNCGYDLTGLQVTDVCPECATPVWSTPAGVPQGPIPVQIHPEALTWGLVALILCLTCIGPLAALVAIPAITKGRAAQALVRTGRYPPNLASSARTGLILGWITVGISIAILGVYALAFLLGAF